MAKYDVTHTCGHSETIDLVGPHTGRSARLDRMTGEPCRDCRNAANAAANVAAGLPGLIGSSRQVAWAESIRTQHLAKLDADITYWRHLAETGAFDAPAVVARREAERTAFAAQTSAAWFIDHR